MQARRQSTIRAIPWRTVVLFLAIYLMVVAAPHRENPAAQWVVSFAWTAIIVVMAPILDPRSVPGRVFRTSSASEPSVVRVRVEVDSDDATARLAELHGQMADLYEQAQDLEQLVGRPELEARGLFSTHHSTS